MSTDTEHIPEGASVYKGVAFVNLAGDPVDVRRAHETLAREKKQAPESFHKGWVVEGIPAQQLSADKADHDRRVRLGEKVKQKGSKSKELVPLAPWSETVYLQKAKYKKVRSKPYESLQAAQDCGQLATRSGWLFVHIRELKKEAAPEVKS